MKNTAVITGASGGLGREFARLFAKDGYNLILAARNGEKLQKLKEEKEQVLFQMEADNQIIELHQSMDELNTNRESDRMLERVREGAKKTRERAEGSRIAYDSSAQANERRLETAERDRNARQILDEMKRQRGEK